MTVACKKDKEAEVSLFAGVWSGQYAGDDQGTWSVTISDNGEISGIGQSTPLGTTFSMKGNVSKDGSFTATIGTVATGSEFRGGLTGEGTATGTWKNTATNPQATGTWSGERH